jgi:hypothetical protein
MGCPAARIAGKLEERFEAAATRRGPTYVLTTYFAKSSTRKSDGSASWRSEFVIEDGSGYATPPIWNDVFGVTVTDDYTLAPGDSNVTETSG